MISVQWSRVATSLVYALRTFAYLAAGGGILVPDTASYSQGGSAWSSPLAASSGLVGGFYGVAILGVVSSLVYGWYLGAPHVTAFRRYIPLLFPYGCHASADGAGAAAAIPALGLRQHRFLGILGVSVCHLQAGLCVALAHLLRGRLDLRRGVLLGCFASMIGQGLLGYFHSGQLRYFFLALIVWAAMSANLHRRTQ